MTSNSMTGHLLSLSWSTGRQLRASQEDTSSTSEAKVSFVVYHDTSLFVSNTTLVQKLAFSYRRFPVLTTLMNGLAVISFLGLLLYILFGFRLVDPYLLLWLTVASSGLASVIWIAAEEFDGTKK